MSRSCKPVKQTWSSNELFDIDILDQRVTSENNTEVLVHYTGWARRFDEWRSTDEIVRKPPTVLDDQTFFQTRLKTSNQEKLTIARKQDSKVEIRIPIQKDIFNNIRHLGVKVHCSSRATKYRPESLENFLDFDWWFRINNKNGDFAYVKKTTARFWMFQRRPLATFSKTLKPVMIDRGHMFVFSFVKGIGNRHDIASVLA